VAAIAVVVAHMKVQEEGLLSCWTVSSEKDGCATGTVGAGISVVEFVSLK
jgi:hypothetical protein